MSCGDPVADESNAAAEHASFEDAINAAIEARQELEFARALDIYDGLLASDGVSEEQRAWARNDRFAALAEQATVLAVRDLLGDRELESVTDFSGATTADDDGREVSLFGKFTFAAAGTDEISVWKLYATAFDQGNDAFVLHLDLDPEDLAVGDAIERTGIEVVGTEIRDAGVDPNDVELDDELKQEVLTRVASDIEQYGWHMVAVMSRNFGSAGFVYTVGLWETYQHPEIILFAPQEDPTLIAGRIKELSVHIALGTKFTAGQFRDEVFGRHPGAFRTVHPDQYANHLGVAGAHYGDFSFPALQLLWPDAKGRFPWQDGYDVRLEQPMLDAPDP